MSKETKKSFNIYIALLLHFALGMSLLMFSRFSFYLFNMDFFPSMSVERFLRICFGGLRFDLSAWLYLNVLYILMLIIPFKFKLNNSYLNFAKYVFFFANGFALFANIADSIYFRFTLRRTTASVFTEFQSNDNMGTLWAQFFIDYWYAVLLWIFSLWLMVWLYRKIPISSTSGKELKPVVFYPVSIALFFGLAYSVVGGMRGGFAHSIRPITISNAQAYTQQPREASLVLNTPFSVIRTFSKKTLKKKDYFDTKQLTKIYPVIHLPDSGEFNKMNVVVIILESFAKEYSGYFNPELDGGNYKGYTPFLDSLAENGLTFWNSFANGGKSIDAMPSVLASMPSIQTPYVLSHYSNNKIEGLGKLLQNEGYQTAFFHGAPNGSMGFDAFANLAGYQQYFGKTEYGNDADYDGLWGIWDDKFFQYHVQEINKMKEPFHTALFSLSSHHPFRVPEAYEDKFPEGTLPIHQCVGYTDNALREFFTTAKQMPWYENTLFVITADHTNQNHFEEYASSAGRAKVPLIFFAPSDTSLRGTPKTMVAQQMDVMPTVLGYLKYPKPFFGFGTNLLDSTEMHFGINFYDQAYHLYQGDYLLQSADGETAMGLYKYQEDLLLQNNIMNESQLEVREMQGFLKAFVQQYSNRLIQNRTTIEE